MKETKRIWTTEVTYHVGKRVCLAGWLHHLRALKQVSFLILRDGKGTMQIVVEDPQLIEQLTQLQRESVLVVEGQVVANPQAPGGVEIQHPSITVVSSTNTPPPIELFRPTIKAHLPTILDHAPVALRHPCWRERHRISAASMHGFRKALEQRDFVEIQTPKIVGAATEGGANVFEINYFGKSAYLSQSPQLYKQVMVGVFERVFEVGPVFRAELHDTSRHSNEYVSLDVEFGFIHNHITIMHLLTEVLREMILAIRERVAQSVALLQANIPEVPQEIPTIHFTEAQELITQATGENLQNEPDLAPAHERWLGAWAQREYSSDFLFVTGYPMVKRPFYTHPDPLQPLYSNSFDLLFRGLELVTGGQRLHQHADYMVAIQERGMKAELLEWYLEAFKHGMPPHGGFAIGLERWVSRLLEISNIRETTLFPRDQTRLVP
ncbi:MAG: aspartate--tRNA(Asn) ligase [Chloroflexi bacterium AL-N10]|nr:aspartate--tRNA(Asn) ligase [Chloroflexi bacterium AL-N1]NOK69866.1 aspartate--tRNA(Asn) ligase [Chloroflexi bacterium AL-N10]NOK73837.1 aspartate--tRNA(Asn) ligase [Chloroflexi bacterium AL-N5]NOK91599.1 aspartate--tRNA(Asn) ligase [Chloroflexi bacterium AL-N15]